jgi:uncharacterized iron-regulated membrane protein
MNTTASNDLSDAPAGQSWLNYRTIWRWHFYAGIFCIPLVLWLSVTGAIYLFRPQIESWLDRPYAQLGVDGPRASAAAQARAALAAVPGSTLHAYQLPLTPHSAVQILVGKGEKEFRVYVHPRTLQILKVINEDHRPMNVISSLHGELLMGDRGSNVVELAASWAIVMIVTGLYLWWPRQASRLAGVLYIRFRKGKRIFWRDLHAVTGVWVSAFALFLLLTGLPWASSWGKYLEFVRSVAARASVRQDWTTGRSSEIAKRVVMNASMPGMPGMNMEPSPAMPNGVSSEAAPRDPYVPLDKLIAVVAPLNLAYPARIAPPVGPGAAWTAESNAQNRTLRTTLTLDGETGAVLTRQDFNRQKLVDRIVLTGVAIHEGQLFGWFNQLLGLFTAVGLILLSVSAVVLWWRRRAVGVLGAPLPSSQPRFSFGLLAVIVAFSIYLPLLGASLLLVLATERFVLRRIPGARRWLGLRSEGMQQNAVSS